MDSIKNYTSSLGNTFNQYSNQAKNYVYNNKYTQKAKEITKSANRDFQELEETYKKIFIKSNKPQMGGLEFHIRKKEALKLQSSITDYVLENNSSVQNAITLKPIEITLTGVFGENVIKAPRTKNTTKFLQSKLNPIAMFSPDLSVQAQQYLNKVNNTLEKVDDIIQKIGSGLDYLTNLTKNVEPKQKKACLQLMTMWMSRQIITIQTDFIVLKNMVIQSVDFSQGEETTDKSECTISFKQLTFTDTIAVQSSAPVRQTMLDNINKGKTPGKTKSQLVIGINKFNTSLLNRNS